MAKMKEGKNSVRMLTRHIKENRAAKTAVDNFIIFFFLVLMHHTIQAPSALGYIQQKSFTMSEILANTIQAR